MNRLATSSNVFAAAGLFGLLLALALVAGSPARALDPAIPAELVYSNGGRIISVGADGSGRNVLTNRGKVVPPGLEGRFGDAHPEVSPDGSKLLFSRIGNYSTRILVADRDGSNAKRIFTGGNSGFDAPTWMPDSQSIAVARQYYRKGKDLNTVVVAGLDGEIQRTVFRLPPHLQGNLKEDLATFRRASAIDVSSDGAQMLVTVDNPYENDRKYLQMVDLATGADHLVSRKAYEGSFSPDGSEFVYVSSAGNRGRSCADLDENVCITQGDLMIGRTDGSASARLLLESAGAERNPSWSPDGLRIAFGSNRNLPEDAAATEIYTIAADGSCLTWLTNGTPESVEPSWVPGVSNVSDPGACGAAGRPPRTEVEPADSGLAPLSTQLWAGPATGGRLLTWSDSFLGAFLQYHDCATFEEASCLEPIEIYGFATCYLTGILPFAINRSARGGIERRRGVAVAETTRGPYREIDVFSGSGIHTISADPDAVTFRELREVFDDLRPLDSTEVPARLPKFMVPRADIRLMKLIQRRVKSRGSVGRAADSLDIGPKRVRKNLKMAQNLKKIGPYRTIKCPADPGVDLF